MLKYFLYRTEENQIPINNVGLINYVSIDWINKLMWKALKVSLNARVYIEEVNLVDLLLDYYQGNIVRRRHS